MSLPENFGGIVPPVATPFTEDGEIDVSSLERVLRYREPDRPRPYRIPLSVDVGDGSIPLPASQRPISAFWLSVEPKPKVATELPTVPLGPDVMVVSGGVVSIVKVRLAGASRLPARSRARTRIV